MQMLFWQNFRLYLWNFFASSPTQDNLAEREMLILDTIYDIRSAIHNGNYEIAQRLLDGFHDKHRLAKCLLWYGARNELTFVRFIVENLKRSKSELLLKFHNEGGENALHVAVNHDQREVAEYLLAEWSQTEVRISR